MPAPTETKLTGEVRNSQYNATVLWQNQDQYLQNNPIVATSPKTQLEVLHKYEVLNSSAKDANGRYIVQGKDATKKFVLAYNQLENLVLKKKQEIKAFERDASASMHSGLGADVIQQRQAKAKQAIEKLTGEYQSIQAHQNVMVHIMSNMVDLFFENLFARDSLRELTLLAAVNNSALIKKILAALSKNGVFTNPNYMKALKYVLLGLNKKFYEKNHTDLIKIASLLKTNLATAQITRSSFHDTHDLIEAMRVVWSVLHQGAANAKISDEQWKQHNEAFKNISGQDDAYLPLRYQAKYIAQSLLHLRKSTEHRKEELLRAFQIISGVASLTYALASVEFGDAAEAAEKIWNGWKATSGHKQGWYGAIARLELLLGLAMHDKKKFAEFKQFAASAVTNQADRAPELSYGIFELFQRIITRQDLTLNIRKQALDAIYEMYVKKEIWQADYSLQASLKSLLRKRRVTGRGNGDESLRKQIVDCLLAVTSDNAIGSYAQQLISKLRIHSSGHGASLLNKRLKVHLEALTSNDPAKIKAMSEKQPFATLLHHTIQSYPDDLQDKLLANHVGSLYRNATDFHQKVQNSPVVTPQRTPGNTSSTAPLTRSREEKKQSPATLATPTPTFLPQARVHSSATLASIATNSSSSSSSIATTIASQQKSASSTGVNQEQIGRLQTQLTVLKEQLTKQLQGLQCTNVEIVKTLLNMAKGKIKSYAAEIARAPELAAALGQEIAQTGAKCRKYESILVLDRQISRTIKTLHELQSSSKSNLPRTTFNTARGVQYVNVKKMRQVGAEVIGAWGHTLPAIPTSADGDVEFNTFERAGNVVIDDFTQVGRSFRMEPSGN